MHGFAKYVLIFQLNSFIHGLPVLNKNPNLRNPFVGFYVFPHGGITLDPETMDYSSQPAFREDSKVKAINLKRAMQSAVDALIQSKPDLIIFSTPHGYRLENHNVIVLTASVSGSAGWIWSDYTAGFDIDKKLSSIIYSELSGVDDKVEILSLGSGQETMPLLWAEVIPWYYISEAASKAGYKLPPAVYIGQPGSPDIDGIRNIGRDIVKSALLRKEFANKRIAVVISGDLSHYHSNDPNSPYPYSPVSKVFDQHIVNWAKIDRNPETENASSDELFGKAGAIQNDAGHCGYTGLVMLHGMLEELVNQDWSYKSKFYSYEAPTYFGMMIASWIPLLP